MSRLRALIWDTLTCAIAACPFVLLAAPPAYAYVDPSVMTYTIQAVAGVAVALSAVLGVALRRSRKVIFRIFKIDENANKVVEEPIITIDVNGPDATAQRLEAEERAKQDIAFLKRGPTPKRLNWPRRFMRALLCCAFLVLTVFIMGPLEIVASSGDSLNFGYLNAAPFVINAGLIAIIVLALILSLIRGRAFDALLTLVVCLGICAYIQALFLNSSLPVADGKAINLLEYKPEVVISTAIWLVIIIGLLVLNAKKKQICRALILALSACLILVQGISLVSITLDEQHALENDEAKAIVTTEGLYEVGSEENVIVFVLDFFDTKVLEGILDNDDPDVLSEFTGFTYYRNSTGSLIPTSYGVPFLLSGQMPDTDENYLDYIARRYNESTFIPDISKQGYDIGIYSDSILTNTLSSYASNLKSSAELQLDVPSLVFQLDKVALYRDMPWLLKPLFWFYTDEINRSAMNESMNNYVMDDVAYGENLRRQGIAVGNNEKVFRFIHLLGAHYPFVMDSQGNAADENKSSKPIQAHGALMIVSEYLRQLKELDLYDGATIIITSDHGEWFLTDEELSAPISPILLVKPSENANEASKPIKTSDIPTGHLDFHATIIDAVGGDSTAYGPTVFDITEASRSRTFWMTMYNGKDWYAWDEYEIVGDALDPDSWTLTGNRIYLPTSD